MAKSASPRRWIKIAAVVACVIGGAYLAYHLSGAADSSTLSSRPSSTAPSTSLMATPPPSSSAPAASTTAVATKATEAAVGSSPVPPAPTTAPLIVDDTALRQAVMTFEAVYASESYADTPDARLAALAACNCVTDQFLEEYHQILANTANPEMAASKQAAQLVVTAKVLSPDNIDTSKFQGQIADSDTPDTGYSVPAEVWVTYLTSTTQANQPVPVYGAGVHHLLLRWSNDAWRVTTIPSTA